MKKGYDIDAENFGSEVKKKLIDLKISQKFVAERMGIKQGYLSDILKNNRYAPDKRREIVSILAELERGCHVEK